MKLIVQTAIMCLFSISFSTEMSGWKLVWQDEFNVNGLPDPNKWGYDVGNSGWGNFELENYTDSRTENARVEDGNLIIEARQDWYQGVEYSSARIVSRNRGDWLYGRIEVRAKIPLGQGLWPAIWMLPTDWEYGGWPASGEIDIMENFALGGIKPYQIEGNVHTQAYNHSIGTNKGASISNLSQIEENFHVYAVEWREDKISFMVDNQIYFEFANEGNWEAWPYDKRFHLIMNVAIGGSLGLTPDPSIFPKKMIVDYVRVYQESNVEVDTTIDESETSLVLENPYGTIILDPMQVENFYEVAINLVDRGATLTLYDIEGKEIFETKISTSRVPLNQIPDGIFNVVILANGFQLSQKIIKTSF